jgi:hypothetical protein
MHGPGSDVRASPQLSDFVQISGFPENFGQLFGIFLRFGVDAWYM